MSTYEPKSAFGKWFHERLPVMDMVVHMTDFPTPRNLNYFWTFGGILTFCLMTQIITGIVIFMHYTPHEQLAFDSVELLRRDVSFGWWIQNVHMVGASMFFAAMYLHIFRGLYYGSYKAPREIIWIIGVVILLLLMATAFMGYVLPWGQMSIWGATVITNFFSAVPLVGESLLEWVRGGFAVNNATLNRFASLHYLFPFIILGMVVLHIWALHVPGNNNPTGLDVQSDKDTLSFHPYYTVKDLFAMLVFMMVFAWFVFFAPNLLGHPDNFIKANPLVTPPHIVPEWYFLPFYAILRAVPDKLGGVILMFGSIAILFVLPWLDRSKIRSAVYRPIYRMLFWMFVVNCVVLTYLGAMPAEGSYVWAARFCTALYFGFFIILPFLSKIEIERELPKSIADSVLK